ncbi:MAG TPA: zinc-dependent metalloprotease [Pyrinomonadaceae bacterium]|nr:zinc-dependent metalloprotease [Pyrinomonadaceae bacterium]
MRARSRFIPVSVLVLSLFLVTIFLLAPRSEANNSTQDPPTPPAGGGQDQPQRPGGRPEQTAEPRPYDRVITKDAKTDDGVFKIHTIKDKVYYEIPKGELDKEFLWVSQIAKTTLGVGYGGQAAGNRVVKWERKGNRILLRSIAYDVIADPKLPVSRAVQASNNDTIIMAFNIEALGKDDSAVIDVTRLFTSEVTEFSARTRLRARGFDATRSFIEKTKSFPTNIEVEVSQTYTSPPDMTPAGGGGGPQPAPNPFATGMRAGTNATVVMHYSMVKLPENPMMPRLFDQRVGYFSIRKYDYGLDEQRAPERRYITRWRLEKKDPNAAISEPVKPIVYYVDPATPTKWIPWIKKGIEDWQPAFEAAGFKNAIIAKEAPSKAEDPYWDPEDARYSVIRYLPSTIENASGPHVNDPRTGEILESDIQYYHNVMNLLRAWSFLQIGPLEPRLQKLPMSDDVMGRLVQYVVAHEVGHTLGFQHNMKASATYPVDKLRDPQWLKTMSHTPTLMDYSRFNYVAQPEDNIPFEQLIPQIGPYDKWATMWGYKPIPGAKSPDEEKKTLDDWAKEQDTKAYLRFSTADARGSDPGENTEAVGDGDAIASTTLGLKNLKRVADLLLPATSVPGEPYDDLEELYGRMLGQWATELNHVTAIVGGFNSQQKHIGQNGVRFVIVPKEKQSAAVRFLNENAFATPSWALKSDILRRIEPSGALARVNAAQERVLNSLLSNTRFDRLVEQEALDGMAAYKPSDFMSDVRRGIWSEIEAGPVKIDVYRRNLQNSYIDLLSAKLNGRPAVIDDYRALIKAELRDLSTAINAAMPRATDRQTRAHLADARDQIAKALDPKFAAPAPVTPPNPFGFDDEFNFNSDTSSVENFDPRDCWPDYAVRIRPRRQ